MSNSFYIFVLCGLLIGQSFSSSLIKFRGEKLYYDLYYHGLPIARACLYIPESDPFLIRASIDTKPLTDLVFKVHNSYELQLQPDTEKPIRYSKRIRQRNITQDFDVRYDFGQLRALMNDTITWKITHSTTNLFIMLYQLRSFSLKAGDTVEFDLDVESESWRAIGHIHQNNSLQIAEHESEYEIAFSFLPDSSHMRRRPWKTDLLTNRITKGGYLRILLGGSPWKIPLLMQTGSGENSIEMKWMKRIQGDD